MLGRILRIVPCHCRQGTWVRRFSLSNQGVEAGVTVWKLDSIEGVRRAMICLWRLWFASLVFTSMAMSLKDVASIDASGSNTMPGGRLNCLGCIN